MTVADKNNGINHVALTFPKIFGEVFLKSINMASIFSLVEFGVDHDITRII